MQQTILKPLLGIAVALGTIGAANAAIASDAQPDLDRASGDLSTLATDSQLEAERRFEIAQFFPFPSGLRDRREESSREVQRCLDKRSRRDRESCLNNLRNERRNFDRRDNRRELSREEKRCLEKRSYRDRESCLTNLRNDRRYYDRQNNDRRPYSQPSYPGGFYRF